MCYNIDGGGRMGKDIVISDEMTVDQFRKIWKTILINEGISEAEFWRQRGSSQSAGNQKTRNGTIKFIEFTNILTNLGYKITISSNQKA